MQFNPLTFVFELINFVVLAVVLHRLVYRPVAAAIAERRAELDQIRTTAVERLALVDERGKLLDARNLELDALRETIFAEATAAAATERSKLLASARTDASAERSRAQAMLEGEREDALGWVREETVKRGVEVAGRLLLELVPEAAHDALVTRLLQRLEAPSDLEPAQGDEVIHVEVSFARAPTPAQSTALKAALDAALGTSVRLAVTEDERLGAGATVRVRDRVFDASVAGQLDLLRDDVRRQLHEEAS